jgi:hypothetical protein
MIEAYAITAVALLAAGAVIGFLVVVSLGIQRDDRRKDFLASTDDRVARGARRATGIGARGMTIPASDRVARGTRGAEDGYIRIPGVLQEASLHRQGGNTTSTPSTFGPAGTPDKHRRLQGDVSQDTVLAEKAA